MTEKPNQGISINNKVIDPDSRVYIIAEMSANHNQSYERAVEIIHAAKASGADAVKLQTYTPDTITMDSDNHYFRIKGTIWEGKNLYQLYGEAYTPWEWQPKLKETADRLGIDLFSSPFDTTAVDFLEEMDVPAYKIASFEIVDIPLLEKVASTGKPVIMSTGMATLAEIEEAVETLRKGGSPQIVLLKCTSAYPAPVEHANLLTLPHLAKAFNTPVGLSDHTSGIAVSVGAAALGACVIEKHFTLSRKDPGPDSSFSLEPHEFKEMSEAVRAVKSALGRVSYEVTEKERESRVFRKSLFVVKDMAAGEIFTGENVRSIRPGHGMHTRYYKAILGKKANMPISRGTPLHWEMIG